MSWWVPVVTLSIQRHDASLALRTDWLDMGSSHKALQVEIVSWTVPDHGAPKLDIQVAGGALSKGGVG